MGFNEYAQIDKEKLYKILCNEKFTAKMSSKKDRSMLK